MAKHAGREFEEPMPNTRTYTDMYLHFTGPDVICAAELATWGVGPDVTSFKKIQLLKVK